MDDQRSNRAGESLNGSQRRSPFQFKLKALLIVTALVAVCITVFMQVLKHQMMTAMEFYEEQLAGDSREK